MALKRRLTFQLPSSDNNYRGIISRKVVAPEQTELTESAAAVDDTRRHYLRLYRGVLKNE
jgi:hypothetical protein